MDKVIVDNEEILLDPDNLKVAENNLNDFLCKFGGIYYYYASKWMHAQYAYYKSEDNYDREYSDRFQSSKSAGCTDKLSDQAARSSAIVTEKLKIMRDNKRTMNLLYAYCKALEHTFACSQTLSHNLRKEMDILGHSTIKKSKEDLVHELME